MKSSQALHVARLPYRMNPSCPEPEKDSFPEVSLRRSGCGSPVGSGSCSGFEAVRRGRALRFAKHTVLAVYGIQHFSRGLVSRFVSIFPISAFLSLLIVLCLTGSVVLQAQEPVSIHPVDVITLYEADGDRVPVITAIDLDLTGKLLIMGGDNHKVRIWNIETQNATEVREQLDWVRGITFGFDRDTFVVLGQDGQMEVRNTVNGDLVRKIQDKNRGAQAIAFRPGSRQFAICGFQKTVPVYDQDTGKIVRSFSAHQTSNRAIRFSPDGSRLAVAGRSGIIRVWNVETGDLAFELPGDARRINALAFSPDGTLLAGGGEGPSITLWDMRSGKRFMTLPERTGKTFSLEFCRGDVLASGESDNTIRFWNLHSGTYYANTDGPNGHTGTIATLVYDARRGVLASGSFDTTVRFWNIPTDNVASLESE